MISFQQIDHYLITVPPGNLEAAKAFYGDFLQLKPIPGHHPQGALWFEMGNIELHIAEEMAQDLSKRHTAFRVANLEMAKIFLSQHQIEISQASVIPGRDRCFFRDPFGNRIELIQFH